MTDQRACRIVIARGRENALAAMQFLEADGFPGVLAIVDADFGRLENAPAPSQNILLTDLHDFECMTAASPAFAKLVNELAEPERVEKFEDRMGHRLADLLATRAAPLGYLRWASLRHRLDLRFEDLAFSKFVTRESLDIDLKTLIQTIQDHSRRHELSSAVIERHVEALIDPAHDPWQVCCGHDLLEILSFALRHVIAGHDAHEVKREVLERELRLAYENTHFQTSELAQAIRHWEQAHPPYQVLANA